MASEKPATIEHVAEIPQVEEEEPVEEGLVEEETESTEKSEEQQQEKNRIELEQSLYSMENLDRPSPEIWPEKYSDVAQFINNFTPPSAIKMPYSKELSTEDQNYLHQLARLPTSGIISKVKELHDIAYQLGVEESKEVTRGKYLSLFKSKKDKSS